MSSKRRPVSVENVDSCELSTNWNLNQDELSSDKNPFLQLSSEDLQKLNAVLSSEQAKLMLGTEFDNHSPGFAMSRSNLSFVEAKSMGSVGSAPSHDLLIDDMDVEMNSEMFTDEYGMQCDVGRRICLEHSYCLVPIPEQDIEVQVISEIETTEKIGDELITISDMSLEDEVVTAEDVNHEFQECKGDEPVADSLKVAEQNSVKVEEEVKDAAEQVSDSVKDEKVNNEIAQVAKNVESIEENVKAGLPEDDESVEQAIREVEEDVKEIEKETAQQSMGEQVGSVSSPQVRRSKRQMEKYEKFERDQLERVKTESLEFHKREMEELKEKSSEAIEDKSSQAQVEDKSISEEEDLKLSESILDINEAVDVLLKMEASCSGVSSSLQLPSTSMAGGNSMSSAVTVEKLFTSDLQPSLMVPNDIFDVTPDSMPMSEEGASTEPRLSDPVSPQSFEMKTEEPKRTGLLTDDFFGRVVKKTPGEVAKKVGVGSGERKSYPKRENRKPPGYLMSVFEPELFSKPDKMKKIECKSEDRQEHSRDDGSPQDFEMDAQPADDIEAFLCKAEGVELPNKGSAQFSDGIEKKDGGKASPKKKIARPIKKGGAISRKKKRLQKGRKKKGPRAPGKSSEQKDSSNDEQNGSDDDEDDDSDDWCSEDDPDRLWCICKQPHNDRFMIGCDRCKDWFHGSCVGVTRKQGREWEKSGKEWICKKCDKESKDGKPKERKLSLKPEEEKLKSEQDDKVSEEGKPILKTAESTPVDIPKKKEKVAAHPQSSPAPKTEDKVHKDPVFVKQQSVNLSSSVPADTSSSSSTQLCIMGCGKPARPNSIFCSNECILQHADESLKMIGKDKERPKTVKSLKMEAPVKIRPESKRVAVINRRTGVVFQGVKAPFEKDLSVWLKQHPTFEVLNVAKLKKMSSPRKTIQLISAKPIPTDQAESPKGKGSIVRALLEEKKKSPSNVVETKPKLPASEARISTESKVQLVHHEVKPGLVRQLSEKRASVELKAKIEPKPKVEAPKPKPAPIKRPSVEVKKVAAEVKPTPVSPPPVLGPEPVRLSVRQTLRDSLMNRSKDADDLTISADEIKQISFNIEEELFRIFNDTGAKYKAKYRSLIFNIKDVRNPGLFRKILQGRIPPHKLVRMTAEELASKELAMWREREVKHTLEMIKREQEEQMQHAPIIKKTHKGDIEIDDPGFAERPKPKVDAVVEPPAALLTDTTESHRSHLFDLNCKICTGKLIPSTEDELLKSSSVSRSISMDSKSPNEDNEESSSAAEKEEEVVEEEEKVEETNTVPEEKSVEEVEGDVVNKVESEKVVKDEEKREKGNLKRKESSKSSASASKKKVKKVRIQKVTFSKAVLSESSDREPSSTVTISSPDSAGASYNEDPNSKTPSVWKGFITMQDVAKFVTNAYKVSGPTDFLNQDIPDTIQVCGRITPSIVWDYLSKVKHSGNKEFLVIRFAPANEEEKVSYISFYTYLSSRSRFGVVGNSSRMIKDFYILPLSAQDPVPATLLPFDGPGFEDPRPHMLLGIIIRHRGKRKADSGDSKSKRSDSLEESIDADDVSEILIGKKVKFDLPEKGGKDDKIPYEPSCTPPLVRSSKKKRRKKTPRSTTPPLDQLTGKNGDSNSPYSPSRSGPMDDDDKPYDPEEAAGDGKVSKALIPGLLSGSVSSQSVSELIDQISMSSNPAEITTTVLASIATATNLEQQRKLLIELTQKVEEQKRQLEMQKQHLANKVTAQVMGVIPAFSSMVPTDAGLGLQSLSLPKSSSGVSESEEAYSPSYTPPLQQSAVYDPEPSSLKLPDTSNISLPPNLQEILESIKKQGAVASVSTVAVSKEDLAPVKAVNVMLEDPIVKNFADIDPAFADEDLSSIPVPSPPKAIAEEPEAVKLTEAEEEDGVRTPPLQPVKPKDPRQQRKQVDPRMKGKVQLEIGKIRKKIDSVGQKKSELSGLSAAELLEKAMKQFDDTSTGSTTVEEDKMETTTTTSAWPKFVKISQNLLPPNVSAVEGISSSSEPPPPGMEAGSEVVDNTGSAFLPESIPLPSIPLPPSTVVNPVVNYPVPPHPFMGPPPPFMGPPPPGFIPPSQPIFPAYQAPFPPPHMMNKGRGGGGGYWPEENNKGEWRGGRGGGGKFRGRGRASRWDRGAGNNSNWNRQGGDTDLRTFNDFSSSKDKDERKDWPAPGQADRDERDQDRFRDRRDDRDRNRDRDRDRRGEDRDRDRGGRDYDRERDRDYDRDRDWERGKGGGGREWDRNRERDKDRDWDRDKDKNRDRDKDRDRGRSRRRD